jgi:hypothetical protein
MIMKSGNDKYANNNATGAKKLSINPHGITYSESFNMEPNFEGYSVVR